MTRFGHSPAGTAAYRFGLLIPLLLIAACGGSGGTAPSSSTSSSSAPTSAATTATAVAPAASGGSACSLLTVDDATQALGQPASLDSVQGAQASSADVCSYTLSGAPSVHLTLNMYRKNGKATFAQSRQQAVAGGAQPVSGLGDDAFIGVLPDGTVGADVLKGDTSFLLTLTGRGQSADAKDAAKKAASAVAGRL